MKITAISFIFSVVLHIFLFAVFATLQFMPPKIKPAPKIMYVKNVSIKKVQPQLKPKTPEKSETKKVVKKNTTGRTETQKTIKPKVSTPKLKPVYKKKELTKKVVKKENKQKKIVKPIKKTKIQTPEEIEEQVKITVLKKNPNFKNWSDERLKSIPLPPGMKSWKEVDKMTNTLDSMNWGWTPPELGNTGKDSENNPSSEPTPDTSITPTPEPTLSSGISPTPTPEGSIDPTSSPSPESIEWKDFTEEKTENKKGFIFIAQDQKFIVLYNDKDLSLDVSYVSLKLLSDENKELNENLPKNLEEKNINKFKILISQEDLDYNKNSEDKLNIINKVLEEYRKSLKEKNE